MFLAAMLMIVAPDGRLRAESGNPARHRPTIAPYAEPRQESNSLVADVLLGLIAEMQMSGLATRRSRLDIVRIKLHCTRLRAIAQSAAGCDAERFQRRLDVLAQRLLWFELQRLEIIGDGAFAFAALRMR